MDFVKIMYYLAYEVNFRSCILKSKLVLITFNNKLKSIPKLTF